MCLIQVILCHNVNSCVSYLTTERASSVITAVEFSAWMDGSILCHIPTCCSVTVVLLQSDVVQGVCVVFFSQIDFYFGDANLPKDKFLQQKIKEHPEGCEYWQ